MQYHNRFAPVIYLAWILGFSIPFALFLIAASGGRANTTAHPHKRLDIPK